MIVAYLESIKYVGHLWPVALVRIVIGYGYISSFIQRLQSGYLEHAYITERLNISEGEVVAPGLYFEVFKSIVQSQWLATTYLLLAIELLVGVSFILGFGVRIASLMGMLLSIHIYMFFDFQTSPGEIYMFYMHLLFFMLGAGRCLGLDYYFYKSRRGLLW